MLTNHIAPIRNIHLPLFCLVITGFVTLYGSSALADPLRFIRLAEAREEFDLSGKGTCVAVLDTSDFESQPATKMPLEMEPEWTNFVEGQKVGQRPNRHGAFIANIVAARRSVAPDARILPLRVYDPIIGLKNSPESIIKALNWLVENHQRYAVGVVLISLGDRLNYTDTSTLGGDYNLRIAEAIGSLHKQRVAVVVGAGNSYDVWEQPGMCFPAIVPECISVGAVYHDEAMAFFDAMQARGSGIPGRIAPFSQRYISNDEFRTDIFAPGVNLYIANGGVGSVQREPARKYHGTELAAGLTAGVVALIQEYYLRENKELPEVSQVETWIRNGARKESSEFGNYLVLDAVGALQAVRSATKPDN